MAGGVTKDAYVKGARLIRHMNAMERARTRMARETALHMREKGEDSVSMAKLATSTTYTVGIRLDEALKHPGSDADIVLREGDQLIIPEFEGPVKISGDVMYANTVSYTDKKNYKWYVRQAGGFGERAKKSKTYVIYPNGTMAIAKRGTEITPGCEIIVPSKHKKESLSTAQWMGVGSSVAGIASMIASMIYLLTK